MPKTQDEIEAFVAQVLDVPAHRAQALKALFVADGEARFEFVAGPAAFAPSGAVHGGVIAMLLEPTAVCALYTILPPDRVAVTADMHVQHLRPIRPHARVELFARVTRLGNALAFCEASASDEGKICSLARLTKAVVKTG
ncbi:MAG: PaaI family thioesterase [Hyphomicrobiales bacterium]|nr:PaaI family thioesterase [Hyphomicrobiales bacterium]